MTTYVQQMKTSWSWDVRHLKVSLSVWRGLRQTDAKKSNDLLQTMAEHILGNWTWTPAHTFLLIHQKEKSTSLQDDGIYTVFVHSGSMTQLSQVSVLMSQTFTLFLMMKTTVLKLGEEYPMV